MLGGKEASKKESIWNNELEPVKTYGKFQGLPIVNPQQNRAYMCPHKCVFPARGQGRV